MNATWNSRQMPLTPAFVLALIFGGAVTPELANPNDPGPMDEFTQDELQIIIDEGQRQLDNATGSFEHVQNRAQVLLTISLAVLAFAVGAYGRLDRVDGPALVIASAVLVLAMVLVVLGLALAGAVIVVRADFDQVDTTQASAFAPPIRKAVAADYATSVRVGEITVAVRVNVFRIATRYTVWGAILTAASYLITS